MAFWGCQVKPAKEAVFVPPPEESKLHISQACIAPDAKAGSRATLLLRVGDADPLAICTLREGSTDNCQLDLVLDEYTEFSVQGSSAVHLSGYFMPDYEIQQGGSEEDEDEEAERAALDSGMILGYDEHGRPVLADEYDSEEDSDYETEDEDELEAELGGNAKNALFLLGEDDDDESGYDSEDDFKSAHEGPLSALKGGVTIEDITNRDEAAAAGNGKPTVSDRPAGWPSAGGSKAAAFSDDDVDGSDEEEEEEAQVAAAKAGSKAANGKEPAAQKRKAEAQPAAQQPKEDKKAKKEKKKENKKEKKEAEAKAAPREDGLEGAANEVPSGKKYIRRFSNGFEIEELVQGRPNGKLAKPGNRVAVRYVGRLKSGKVFDQTKGSKPFSFRLGVGEVIKGWDRGVEGMRVGDKRRLAVPPAMGYGSSRVGDIPPNSTLVFEVELVDVKG